ncbi:MAG: phospholipase D-like domain-containing protein [Anaerolineales bacterium]|nr:phospholipase D-like domain-containing protein [Anaerolineales bacterium]MCX7609341.1 phospholipase D-like domain-containing protein [Anaerolineales bacterium]MDW8226532.1 phospholipase D-like domain-containing protein [Anaerolineales bacterium]
MFVFRLCVLACSILLLLTSCDDAIPIGSTDTAAESWVATTPASQEAWTIYFSDPFSPYSQQYQGGPDEALAKAIDSARLSVDVAVYSLNLWSIRDALIQAHRRGVVVRVVIESDNMDVPEVRSLIEAGIPVLGDRREGLMHNKFVILDRREVWTGSMNLTVSSAYHSYNNLIQVRSPEIAQNYLTEFEEMFVEDLFGEWVKASTPHPRLVLNDSVVEIYFSPDDGVAARILELIRSAERSIYFLAYSFTSDEIGEAIREQARNGLTVAGVMEEEQVQSNQGTEYDAFKQAFLDVRLEGSDALMHHKVIILDETIVVTGSYNFTISAEKRNDENVVILHHPQTAEAFLEEFWRIYRNAKP